MMKLSLALGAALLFSTPAVSETILVHAGTLLAVPGSDPVTERTLVIRDGKIAEIRDGFVSLLPGEDVALIDLSDRFVIRLLRAERVGMRTFTAIARNRRGPRQRGARIIRCV